MTLSLTAMKKIIICFFLFCSAAYSKSDLENSYHFNMALAEQGHVVAQYNLGIHHYSGRRGIPQDYKKAFLWYKKAASRGFAPAQFNLCVMYQKGQASSVNHENAFKWCKKAAEQGEALAQYNLAIMFHDGVGVNQNYGEAIKWYKKAAEQGVAFAQINLGLMNEKGEGFPENFDQAAVWYKKAAEKGNSRAQFRLGVLAMLEATKLDELRYAADWFEKAAEQKHAMALYNLGIIYSTEIGAPPNVRKLDKVLSHYYFFLSEIYGFDSAKKEREAIEEMLTETQLQQSHHFVSEWLKEH